MNPAALRDYLASPAGADLVRRVVASDGASCGQ